MIPDMLESIQSRLKKVFYLDLRMLACFRLGLGSITLWDLINRASAFKAHYGMSGILPPNEATLYADFNSFLPLHLWFTSDVLQACLFFAHGLAAVAVIFGIKTRWATVICWLLLNSLHLRNPIVLYGADRQLAALFFWSMFLPLGARWSIDSKQRIQWQGKSKAHGWFCAGLMLQIALIYFTSAWSKSGESWMNGTAVRLALNIDTYTSDLGRVLLGYPALLSALTYSTLIAEWLAPLLLFGVPYARLRSFGCWILIGLQIGFLLFMDLGLFPLVSILALIAILPNDNAPQLDESRNENHSNAFLNFTGFFFVSLMLFWQIALIRHQFSSNSVLANIPEPLPWILKTTRLSQSWSMFSPDPPDRDGWFILEHRKTGHKNSIDLLTKGSPLSWEKSATHRSALNSDRWKEWFNKVYARGLNWKQTIRYFHLENASTIAENKSEGDIELRLWFMEESAQNPLTPPTRHLLFEQSQTASISDR